MTTEFLWLFYFSFIRDFVTRHSVALVRGESNENVRNGDSGVYAVDESMYATLIASQYYSRRVGSQ